MSVKDWIRKYTPTILLKQFRNFKKNRRNSQLHAQKNAGKSFSMAFIAEELREIGIQIGDTVLVHSSLSKIGHLEEGPKTFVDAILSVVGETGHVLMPTSPNNVYQLNYIRNTPFFDVVHSPSKTGAITEYFRKLPGAVRSLHPTEPVSAIGPNAISFLNGHFMSLTPYTENSPFAKVAEANGKILYVGVTLDNAGTSLHTLEDAINDFKFPIYYPEIFTIDVIDDAGVKHKVKTKVHDPKYSNLRKCDELIPHFEKAGVLKYRKIGNAKTLVVDAKGFFDTMVELYHQKGITMYTPNGEVLNG
jgi:aminoglycoside 3-N-acetyltransferase